MFSLEKIRNQKTIKKDNVTKFINEKTFKERNAMILVALDDGYSQIAIANYLNVSRSLVSKIIRE